MVTQWSNLPHSTSVLTPVAQEYNGGYRHPAGQSQQDVGCSGIPGFYPLQVMGNGRFARAAPYHNAGIKLITALEGHSLQQVLMQMTMNSIQKFDGTNKEATIPWLDNIKAVAKKTGFDPLEVCMSNLKGTMLSNVKHSVGG